MWISLKRILRAGRLNFKRNFDLSLITVFVMFLTVSLITVIFLFRGAADFLVSSLEKKIDISVYFKQETSNGEVLKAKELLSNFEGVKGVEYVSSEQALAEFKERHKYDEAVTQAVEEVGDNPFLPSLNITAGDSLQYEKINEFLQREQFKDLIDKIDFIQRKPMIERFYSLKNGFEKTGMAAILALVIIAFSVTFITIRLSIYSAADEVAIMRLVGAGNWFIRGPFLVQGVICGIIAVVIGLAVFAPLIYFLSPNVFGLTGGFDLLKYFAGNFWEILGLQLLSGVGLGVVSSLVAVKKYLEI